MQELRLHVAPEHWRSLLVAHDQFHATVLHRAARYGARLTVLDWLLQAEEDAGVLRFATLTCTNHAWLPLHSAAHQGHREAARRLLKWTEKALGGTSAARRHVQECCLYNLKNVWFRCERRLCGGGGRTVLVVLHDLGCLPFCMCPAA